MGWRERFGADDERAQIAARARALLDAAAGSRPSPGGSPSGAAEVHRDISEPPLPSPRGGWVPPAPAMGDAVPEVLPATGRHAIAGAAPPPVLRAVEPDDPAWGPDPVPRSARPARRDRFRIEPGRRGLVAVAAVVVVIGSVAGGVMFRGGQSSAVTVAAASGGAPPSAASVAPVEGGSNSPAAASPSAVASSSPAGTVTVDVAGLVAHPGVYTLPAGSRVEAALAAAGGAKPGADLSSLNRARVLVDGEQLAVGVPGATAPPVGAASAGAAPVAGAPVNLNTAGLAELDTLPGVGPVLAQAILDWRTEHARFSSIDDLDQVTGIGPATFAKLKDLVTV